MDMVRELVERQDQLVLMLDSSILLDERDVGADVLYANPEVLTRIGRVRRIEGVRHCRVGWPKHAHWMHDNGVRSQGSQSCSAERLVGHQHRKLLFLCILPDECDQTPWDCSIAAITVYEKVDGDFFFGLGDSFQVIINLANSFHRRLIFQCWS